MRDLNQNLLRHNQREEIKADINSYDQMLVHAKPEDKGILLTRKKRAEHQLSSQSPEPLTGAEKDKLNVLEKKLRARITTNMPTEEVMRKNPAGAVDWHQRWEKANKHLVRMWKNAKIQLNPDSSDRDLANIERFRPSGQTDRMRTDAQIPGLMSYGNVAEEDWNQIFDAPKNTALEQAKKAYTENTAEEDVNAALDAMDAEAEVVEVEKGYGPSGKLTLEEYTALDTRLRAGREALAKKREAAKQLNDTLDSVPVSPLNADLAATE